MFDEDEDGDDFEKFSKKKKRSEDWMDPAYGDKDAQRRRTQQKKKFDRNKRRVQDDDEE